MLQTSLQLTGDEERSMVSERGRDQKRTMPADYKGLGQRGWWVPSCAVEGKLTEVRSPTLVLCSSFRSKAGPLAYIFLFPRILFFYAAGRTRVLSEEINFPKSKGKWI